MQANKLYYKSPYTKEFTAHVISCNKSGGAYEIELENTAFYPEGGGQPSDTGHIGPCAVTHVYEKNGSVIHIGDKSLDASSQYPASINWEVRFDHMQHHSAEHLVSGIIHKLHGADNVGFNIGEQYVTIDFNKELNAKDIVHIENLANEAIHKNLPVKVEYFDTAPAFSYRSKKELSGTVRIVSIDGYDICACAGTQLAATGEIGIVKIISAQKYKGGSRLYLLCGMRALKDYRQASDNISAIGALLSCKPGETAEYTKKLHEEKESLKFGLVKARYELIDIKTEAMAAAGKILIFEAGLSNEEMKKYTANLIEKSGLTAIFSGCDEEGYRYMITGSKIDLPAFIKDLNAALKGKGGGKGSAGGHVAATKAEIEKYFN